jgi:hypothetical protein
MSDFKPPVDNLLVLSFAKAAHPLALHTEQIDVRASARCITTIRRLPGQTVILANHADRSDPTTFFTLAKLCNEDFYYLAARELFDQNFGFRGWMLQRCGAYSVIRGDPPDQESKEKTISLIAEGKRKLVMFPEGDVSGRDDFIRPLKEDGIHNLFEAQKRRLERGMNEPVFLLPVAAYYQATDEAIERINRCVSLLEARLAIPTQPGALSTKVHRVAAEVVHHLERYYHAKPGDKSALEKRLRDLCAHVTLTVATLFDIETSTDDDEATQLYSVRGKLKDAVYKPDAEICRYCLQLAQTAEHRTQMSVSDLETMQQLLILASTLEQPFTPEAAWRIVDRLEFLVTRRLTGKGRRIVWLEAASPIDLRDFVSEFEKNEAAAVERINHSVREALVTVLQELKQQREGHGAAV